MNFRCAICAGGERSRLCAREMLLGTREAFERYREHWPDPDAPRHLYLHTRASMRRLAERHVESDSTPARFIGSELYRRDISADRHAREGGVLGVGQR